MTPWLSVVTDSVKSIRYGVVQIVVHDSKVVQIERTERTRFDVPQADLAVAEAGFDFSRAIAKDGHSPGAKSAISEIFTTTKQKSDAHSDPQLS